MKYLDNAVIITETVGGHIFTTQKKNSVFLMVVLVSYSIVMLSIYCLMVVTFRNQVDTQTFEVFNDWNNQRLIKIT
jgi:hypothetical protein